MTKTELVEKLVECKAFIDNLTYELMVAKRLAKSRKRRIDRAISEVYRRDRMVERFGLAGVGCRSIPNHRL